MDIKLTHKMGGMMEFERTGLYLDYFNDELFIRENKFKMKDIWCHHSIRQKDFAIYYDDVDHIYLREYSRTHKRI